MGVRSAKDAIREARIKAGLTQEELSEGICSPRSLSRIENGMAGVSPATFQALMEHAGASCGQFPVFANRKDFDCFYALKHACFYLDAWQLKPAYAELRTLEEKGWAGNKLYYQEWLLLHCRLQRRSCRYDHRLCYDILLYALHVTRPQINLSDFHTLLLSQNEIQLLIAIAHEALYLGDYALCLKISDQVGQHLASGAFTAMERDRMQAEAAIVRAKYLFTVRDYENAYKATDTHRHQMAVNTDTVPLFELTFLAGLCLHYIGDSEGAAALIKAAFYSAYAVDSPYATLCRNYLVKETDILLTAYMRSLPDIPLTEYPTPEITAASMSDAAKLSDGIYEIDSPDIYTLGSLLRDLRTEQKVPQQTLCQGLCSKSTLSKIENGSLQPDIALTEALLQRLGVSERIFTFWGDERDFAMHDLKFKLIHNQIVPTETLKKYLNEMELILNDNNGIYRQVYLMLKALQADSAQERIAELMDALHVTLPNFDTCQIGLYRLSWAELSILNNIAHEYRCTQESHHGIHYFLQILKYVRIAKPDILLQSHFLPVANRMYCRSLYLHKLYNEVLALHGQTNLSITKSNVSSYGAYLFFYSQACGECHHFEDMVLTAVQACAISDLMGMHKNTVALKKYIDKDFSTDLPY